MTCYKNDHPAGKMTKGPCFIFNKSVIMQVDDTEQYYCPIMKGREGIMEPRDFKAVDEILEQYNCDKQQIIAILQDVQDIYRYLPQDVLAHVSEKTGMSESEIYGVATFYGNFSLDAKGKYVLKVCRGTACHVRKSADVLAKLQEITGLNDKKSLSDDGLFSLEIVSCLGACGLSPVVMVNDTVHAAMTPDKAKDLIADLRAGEG